LSRAAFIACQKTRHGVPYAVACRALGVSESWFRKWHHRPPAPAEQRRAEVDQAVAAAFEAPEGTCGPPGIHAHRDFSATGPNLKWCGDITEIPADEGKFYLATALELFSRRLLGYATSAHPDAVLAGQAIKMYRNLANRVATLLSEKHASYFDSPVRLFARSNVKSANLNP
jgi:putative transposase